MKKALVIEPHFGDIKTSEKIRKAADLGFDGVELWDCAKPDADEIGAIAANLGIEVVGCIISGLFDNHLNRPYTAVEASYRESVAYMKSMGCNNVLYFPGNLHPRRDAQKCIIIENLKRLADIAGKDDITVFIEPINNIVDHIGHYLDNTPTAAEIVRTVNSPNIRMIYDIYHMQVMEGNVIQTIRDFQDVIAHYHSAGVPGRGEHHLGELNYPAIIKAIEETGYDGYFCLEYLPTYDSEQSIRNVLDYLRV